jgi:DNA-binding PadR family transcriptional regulator
MKPDSESSPNESGPARAAHRRNGRSPRLSRRERLILELLADGEMAGLQLVAASPKLRRGAVYVTLRRLADKGLVASRRARRGRERLPLRLFRATVGAPPPALEAATC